MHDSVDVTLKLSSLPTVCNQLRSPKKLVVARITPTPTQQFLDVRVVVVAMNNEGMLNNKKDNDFNKAYRGSTLHCLLPIPRIRVQHRLQAKLKKKF
jgi:hypothetical protein